MGFNLGFKGLSKLSTLDRLFIQHL